MLPILRILYVSFCAGFEFEFYNSALCNFITKFIQLLLPFKLNKSYLMKKLRITNLILFIQIILLLLLVYKFLKVRKVA